MPFFIEKSYRLVHNKSIYFAYSFIVYMRAICRFLSLISVLRFKVWLCIYSSSPIDKIEWEEKGKNSIPKSI